MIRRSEQAAEVKRAIEVTLHVKSSGVPLYHRVAVWVAVLAVLAVVGVLLLMSR